MLPIEQDTDSEDEGLGEMLRYERLERGETQEEVARHAGLTVAAYARIERGAADPKWTTVRSIVDALEISLAGLDSQLQLSNL